ncbi:MAG: hypothetical protein JXB32_00705 [Deltaproteobacteria bacterium]|nr:hypothetical protein [Deltaproteobacteria bacterium]
MKRLGLSLFTIGIGLCLALGACKKKEDEAATGGGGGGGGTATPAADQPLTVTPENIEKILAKADELITEELGSKAMNGTATPEEGMKLREFQEQAIQAGGLNPDQLMAWVEFLMKEENAAFQMRWATVIMGQPDQKP